MKYEYLILYPDNTWYGSENIDDIKQNVIDKVNDTNLKPSEIPLLFISGGCMIIYINNGRQLLQLINDWQ